MLTRFAAELLLRQDDLDAWNVVGARDRVIQNANCTYDSASNASAFLVCYIAGIANH